MICIGHGINYMLYCILPTRIVELCRKQSYRITFFVERQGWEICDILQIVLAFATFNKVNLFPCVVQLVFSNL